MIRKEETPSDSASDKKRPVDDTSDNEEHVHKRIKADKTSDFGKKKKLAAQMKNGPNAKFFSLLAEQGLSGGKYVYLMHPFEILSDKKDRVTYRITMNGVSLYCRSAADAEDDRVIAEMERKLGLKKKSKNAMKQEFALDGLDGTTLCSMKCWLFNYVEKSPLHIHICFLVVRSASFWGL